MCNNLYMKTAVLLVYNFLCLINLYWRITLFLGTLVGCSDRPICSAGRLVSRARWFFINLEMVDLKIDMFCYHNHAEDKINVNMKILSRNPYGSYIIFQYIITYTCLGPYYDKCSDYQPTRIYSIQFKVWWILLGVQWAGCGLLELAFKEQTYIHLYFLSWLFFFFLE